MILDEAIKHAEEVADKKEQEKQKWERWLEHDSDNRAVAEKESCELCAKEHRQLAEWLKELKQLRERQSCEEAISRQAALASIKNLYPDMPIVDIMGARRKWLEKYAPYFECENAIEQLPSVSSQKPKTGHWIAKRIGIIDRELYCDQCGEEALADYPSRCCSNCGAKMIGDIKDIEPQEVSDKK